MYSKHLKVIATPGADSGGGAHPAPPPPPPPKIGKNMIFFGVKS